MNEITFAKWKEQMVSFAKPTQTPICVTFELTARCNLDCKMCYIHNQGSNTLHEKELSTQAWKHVFDDAYDCGMMFAILTGGECLLRQDFKELYLHLWKKRVFVTVLTNGVLLNDDYIEFFKNYKPERIQISLYGSSEEGYLNVTGHKGFEKTVSTIHKLMKAYIPVQVAVTPNRYMKDDYISILRYCIENGFSYKPGEFALLSNRDDSNKNDHYLSLDEIEQLSRERAKLSGTLVDRSPSEIPPCGGTCKEAPKGLACNAGKTSLTVSWDGRMCLCTGISISQASVLEMSYVEAWENTKKAASEILLGAECVGCPYDELCPKCPAIRLDGFYTGHCNPRVCEMTRRLVVAGVKKLPMLSQEKNE